MNRIVEYDEQGHISRLEYTGDGLVPKYYRCECRKCTAERNQCYASIGDFETIKPPPPLPTTVRDVFSGGTQ